MSVEVELKDLILQRYKSIRAFCLELNIPYSTIDTMLKKGVSGTAVLTIIKICNALDIDPDALAYGRIQNKPYYPSINFSKDEEAHIIKYRALDDYGQNTVDVVLNIQYERCIKEHSKNTEDEPKSNIITPTFSEPTPEYGMAKAAHATKGASKEHYQESEDILNNADRRSHDIDC